MVGLGTRTTIERGEIGNSQPKAARASALPDRRRRAECPMGGNQGRDSELTNPDTRTPVDCGG